MSFKSGGLKKSPGVKIPDEELDLILSTFRKDCLDGYGREQSYLHIGELVGRSPEVIRKVVNRYHSTVNLAKATIQAGAIKLAKRIVQKATVAEAMDVLSRPNVGVLDPKQASGEGGGAFFLSVQADSCGAVKIGAGYAVGSRSALSDEGRDTLGLQEQQGHRGEEYDNGGHTLPRGISAGHTQDGGPQIFDVESEEEEAIDEAPTHQSEDRPGPSRPTYSFTAPRTYATALAIAQGKLQLAREQEAIRGRRDPAKKRRGGKLSRREVARQQLEAGDVSAAVKV